MGKVDDLRRLREAMYNAHQKMAPRPARAASASDAAAGEPRKAKSRATLPEAIVELCGHRSIGNKTCTRPKDHAEKNHRYKT